MRCFSDWHYVLDGKTPIAVDTSTRAGLLRWANFMQQGNRRVACDRFCAGVEVSTVFLGLDHGYMSARPVLFETMVFGGKLDGEMDRYFSWEEAEHGHQRFVARVRYAEGERGYSRSHWRKIRQRDDSNVIPFPRSAAA